jgi:hypothetical protein
MTKTIFDSVTHTRFPKEDHLPDWARRDNQVKKGDRVEHVAKVVKILTEVRQEFWRCRCHEYSTWKLVTW